MSNLNHCKQMVDEFEEQLKKLKAEKAQQQQKQQLQQQQQQQQQKQQQQKQQLQQKQLQQQQISTPSLIKNRKIITGPSLSTASSSSSNYDLTPG